MLGSICKTRKRLTRQESKAQTRAALLTVARAHFLRYGLGGAVADKIAEDAGFSRGALYCNFESMEDLFLAVIEQEHARYKEKFDRLCGDGPPCKDQIHLMRDAIADMVTDRDWVILRAEYEAGALVSERLRRGFAAMHREQVRHGCDRIRDLQNESGVELSLKPDDFIMVMLNLSHGLAVTQRILGSELSQKDTRRLIQNLFDRLIAVS
jgi:AcrR family transcriptional regulator